MNRFFISALLIAFSASAQAAQVRLFAFINVDETATTVSTDQNGSVSIDSFSLEKSYILGWNDSLRQQIVAKVDGCNLLSSKVVNLKVSDTPHAYAGFFSKTTYKLATKSSAECKEVQKRLRRATYETPVILDIDAASKTFSLR
ncbi:MAG: hypothetical protein NDI61_05555 [Bdellovibrionaceae bacterium]|nr:hypothetical protein [Pseudobdellovibrionaceae bacterium]